MSFVHIIEGSLSATRMREVRQEDVVGVVWQRLEDHRGLSILTVPTECHSPRIPLQPGTNGDGQPSERRIRPVACFPAGRYVYVRAHCSEAREMRTFRVDRIEMA